MCVTLVANATVARLAQKINPLGAADFNPLVTFFELVTPSSHFWNQSEPSGNICELMVYGSPVPLILKIKVAYLQKAKAVKGTFFNTHTHTLVIRTRG